MDFVEPQACARAAEMFQTPRGLRTSLHMEERRYRLFRNLRGWLASLFDDQRSEASVLKSRGCSMTFCTSSRNDEVEDMKLSEGNPD